MSDNILTKMRVLYSKTGFCFIYATMLGILLLSLSGYAQTLPCFEIKESKEAISEREKRVFQLKQKLAENLNNANHTVQYIPIKAHIIRDNSGNGGVSLTDLNKALVQVNVLYINLGSGVQFYFCGSPNYIDNSNFYDFDNVEEGSLCKVILIFQAL